MQLVRIKLPFTTPAFGRPFSKGEYIVIDDQRLAEGWERDGVCELLDDLPPIVVRDLDGNRVDWPTGKPKSKAKGKSSKSAGAD